MNEWKALLSKVDTTFKNDNSSQGSHLANLPQQQKELFLVIGHKSGHLDFKNKIKACMHEMLFKVNIFEGRQFIVQDLLAP